MASNGRGLRLGETVVVRIYHDLAGPIGALANGIELLAMEHADGGAAAEILGLLQDSARALAARLNFLRAVFGAPTARALKSAGATEAAARAYLAQLGDRSRSFDLVGFPVARERSPEWWRLALVLVLVGAEALPFSGRIVVTAVGEHPDLRVEGRRVGWPEAVLAGFADVSVEDPRAAAAVLLAVLAGEAGVLPRVRRSERDCCIKLVSLPLENSQV